MTPGAVPDHEVSPTDGRTARRERNRLAVVDATLALMHEGDLDPAIETIAVRSGVSVRSVFRYFDSLDDLQRETIRRHFERIEPLVAEAEVRGGPLEERIERFVAARLRLFEAIAGPARVARMRAPVHDVVAVDLGHMRRRWFDQLRAAFAGELAAIDPAGEGGRATVVDTVVSFESWDQLVTVHGCDAHEIQMMWVAALGRLLRPDPA